MLFFPSGLCSNAVVKSTCEHVESKLTFKEKKIKMTGASPASQREEHSWMSTPWAFCINNWQYPEIFGAEQRHAPKVPGAAKGSKTLPARHPGTPMRSPSAAPPALAPDTPAPRLRHIHHPEPGAQAGTAPAAWCCLPAAQPPPRAHFSIYLPWDRVFFFPIGLI